MIDNKRYKYLSRVLEKKIFSDDLKSIDKQLRNLRKKLEVVEIAGDVIAIQESLEGNIVEMKKVLQSNNLC